jgi:tRNA pseudouridine32 synthase/23S rRNA pseudouridine746 synthase
MGMKRMGSNMPSDFEYRPPTVPWLTTIHQDRDMVVLDKPAGLLSIPGKTHNDSALSRVLGEHPHAYAVHRLDMDTSGIMVIALRRKAEAELQRQFRMREVQKCYIALVWGHLAASDGIIDAPLLRVPGQPPRSVIDWNDGRAAQTEYKVVGREGDCTRVELRPLTGRSHQLRVHMWSLGHPIVGDRFYGTTRIVSPNRLHLHAQALGLKHPFSGEPLKFEALAPF